jgi:hypothetical protein
MKSLTIYTLIVAVALGTASMAASAELSSVPLSQLQKDTVSATATISTAPLYAPNRLDAQVLAEQVMTDQELNAVEGRCRRG